MKILIINSSHRHGNTDSIITKVKQELLAQKQDVRELNLRELEMQLPDGGEHCAESEICPNITDQFSTEIEPQIRDFDAYIVATPVYSDAITPLLKIFWDRIVSWCHPTRMYLKGKKIGLIVHGMAGKESNDNVINWMKSVCVWEEAQLAAVLALNTLAKAQEVEINKEDLLDFTKKFQ